MVGDSVIHDRYRRLLGTCALSVVLATSAACEDTATEQAAGDSVKYTVTDGDVHQALRVSETATDSIQVDITVSGQCSRQETGIATPAPGDGDMDIEVDEEGDGYPVDVYFLEPRASCTISVRLAAGDESLAWVRDTGCPDECPFSDAAMDRN